MTYVQDMHRVVTHQENQAVRVADQLSQVNPRKQNMLSRHAAPKRHHCQGLNRGFKVT